MIQKKINLNTNIQYLKGVGPKMAERLNKLGIETISDLVLHFPRAYKDYTQISKIADLTNSKSEYLNPKQIQNSNFQILNDNKTIKVKVVGIENKRTSRRGFTVTEAVVADNTGSLQVVWFNQPFLKKILKAGSELLLNGSIGFNKFSNSYVMESPDRVQKLSIAPVYPETKGVTSAYIGRLIVNVQFSISNLKEYLPKEILKKYSLMEYTDAAWQMHLPENSKKLSKAKERLAFDELFMVALRARINRQELKNLVAPKMQAEEKDLKKFVGALPFKLTNDQKRTSWRIIQDMGNQKTNNKSQISKPEANACVPAMNRLLNGDVGSGKTVVAALAIYVAYLSGYKSILMAPTQILANQHFETLKNILKPFGLKIALITADSKKNYSLPSTSYHLIIGTQAILHLKEKIENIGLVVVDEQHRFGVKQRAAVKKLSIINNQLNNYRNKNCKLDIEKLQKVKPHFLSMTATPIPRTLYLSLFSDLDISIIKEMPKGRKPVKTKFVSEENRDKTYEFIKNQVGSGRQVFVICPLIEESASTLQSGSSAKNISLFEIDKKSVVKEYKKLNEKVFPSLRIGMLHGKMKSREKDAVMSKFANKELDILVSTSVVEVGVDIANATTMMIEDAEKFGLAQLHQFRGRVGRDKHQSYCFVFSSSKNPQTISRLKSFENILDGFELAEIDLKNRGAGQIFGKIQSGHFDFIHADLSDRILVSRATKAAKELVSRGIDKYPFVERKLEEIENARHME